jgi:integrase
MTPLRKAVHDYLVLRRSLGFKLHKAGKALPAFITFMEQQRASVITSQLALTWAQQPTTVQPAEWAYRLSMVRGFARHRSATDPRTEIPPGLLPYRPKRARPYIYSDEEIRRLLRAALALSGHRELRRWTYYCLFGLLSVSGLRISEARDLELQDVDLRAGVLTIRGAKFGKSRLIPLHASTRRVLADYLARRGRRWAGRSVSSYVFVSSRGNRLDGGDIHRTFYTLSRQIGLRGPSDRHGPRLHDLRHSSGTRIIPSPDRHRGNGRGIARLRTDRWRHNQSVFRKANGRSRRRERVDRRHVPNGERGWIRRERVGSMSISTLLLRSRLVLVSSWGMVPSFQETDHDDSSHGCCNGIHPTRLRRATRLVHRSICGVPHWRGVRLGDRSNQVWMGRGSQPLAHAPRIVAGQT